MEEAFHRVELTKPMPPWVKPGDLLMLAPANWHERVLALEAFWSAWKDVEASGVGYSASFTEAAKRLKELEG